MLIFSNGILVKSVVVQEFLFGQVRELVKTSRESVLGLAVVLDDSIQVFGKHLHSLGSIFESVWRFGTFVQFELDPQFHENFMVHWDLTSEESIILRVDAGMCRRGEQGGDDGDSLFEHF